MQLPPGPLRRLLVHVRRHRLYALLTVLFGAAGFLLSFAYPWIIGTVVDLLVASGPNALSAEARRARLTNLTELAFATAILHAVVVYGRGHFNVHLGDGVVTDLRRKLFEHLQTLSLGFYTKERTGSILSRILHDVQAASAILYMGIIVAGMDAVQLAIAVGLLSSLSAKLTVACMLVFPLYALVFAFMNPRVRRISERVNAQIGFLSANMAEQVAGQSLIKTYTAERREIERFSADVDRHHELVIAQSHEGHLVASSSEVFVHLGTTIVIGYGGWLVMQGEMTAGMMTRFLGYVIIMYGPVRRFAELNITYQSSMSAIRRVFHVFDIRPAVVEPPRPHRRPPPRGAVSFENVRFHYPQENDGAEGRLDGDDDRPRVREARPEPHWVLDGINLQADAGERIAVVGPSGAGKTTLVSLIPRLYDATSGVVKVDGLDVRAYSLFALRSTIAIVQQDSFVFTGTVRDNIAYGRPDATLDEVVAAAEAAHAHEFVSRFPNGYTERLGERGVNLSGGQRQRISIARALLKNPRILILDEATSSLDAESEGIVQRALERLMRNRTCFIIAHRLSTIRNADRIVVIDGGRVAETGTHAGLLGHNGTYARLVRTQTAVGV